MTPEYFAARPEWTVEETAERIREVGGEVETVLYLYIVDEKGRLIDDVHIARLVMARPGTKLAELVDDSFVSLSAFDDREVAVAAFKKYDRFILPVVDRAGVLLGIVTVDDVLDVEEEEATEDVHLFGGQAALEHPYFSARPIEMLRKRAGWLTFLFASGSLTAFTISQFEDLLQRIVTLAFFIPLVISTGGNSGSQSASMIIRGLAIREIDMADWRRVFRRELSIGLTLGALLGLLLGGFILASIGLGAIEQGPAFAVVAMVSVTAIVTLGALLGGLMPFFFKRIGFDPATSSAPCISTIMDVSGTLLYLGLAAALMSVI
jgi:magnesium transporter